MKKYYLWLIPILILLAVGTIYDLQISQWQDTVNDNFWIHKYYRFFEIFGGSTLGVVFALCFGFFANYGKRIKNKLLQTSSFIALVIASSYTFISYASFLVPEAGNSGGTITATGTVICILLGLTVSGIIYKLFDRISDPDLPYYFKIAIACLTYVVVLSAIIFMMKITWARPRYWMVANGDANFIPWYVISGNPLHPAINAYRSFPSGHTANAFVGLAICLWFPKYQKLLFNSLMVWGLLTAISRIFAGQHYLTDTIVGGLISVTLFFLIIRLFKIELNVN